MQLWPELFRLLPKGKYWPSMMLKSLSMHLLLPDWTIVIHFCASLPPLLSLSVSVCRYRRLHGWALVCWPLTPLTHSALFIVTVACRGQLCVQHPLYAKYDAFILKPRSWPAFNAVTVSREVIIIVILHTYGHQSGARENIFFYLLLLLFFEKSKIKFWKELNITGQQNLH